MDHAGVAAGRSAAPFARGLLRLALLAACALGTADALAWSRHALATGPALAALPEFAGLPVVKVESIESFVAAEGASLEKVLDDEELWARAHVPTYPPRSDALRYTAAGSADAAALRRRFVAAVRIAPDLPLALFLQRDPDGPARDGRPPLAEREVTTLPHDSSIEATRFVALREGEEVRPIEVVTSASDEPDYGLDLGLFEDNGTPQGRIYGFGKQPFGNPALSFGSQAPFHMGFYHEAWIIYAAAGFLKRTYPEYRIHLWRTLARHAFATGHDYWGGRFTGWALHYVQDLTQPYHARVLPDVGTARMLWINALYMAGWPGARDRAVTLVSNRHLALENFQRTVLQAGHRDLRLVPAWFAALAGTGSAAEPVWDDDSPRRVVSLRAAEAADALDATIAATLPARYVSDPSFDFGASEDGIDLFALLGRDDPAARAVLVQAVTPRMADFGAFTRAFLRSLLAPRR